MRAASGRFGLNLGRSNKDNSDKDGEPAQSGHGRVASGGGGANGGGLGAGELAKSVKGKIAHTTILPSLMGNQNLRELQDLITNEKSVIQNEERLGNSISQAGQSLALWGAAQGSDLSDVLAHANTILQHLAQALQTYAARSGDIRILLKNIRSREETLEDLLKRRRQTGSRAEREEKKLAKMGQENKNLQAQTELLQSLRDQMRQMDTDILIEEAKLGDYKRQATKEALAIKFGGCFELAEKAQIVGELGKLLIEEIPLEETPPGYGRAPYEGFEQTQRLSTEAERVINDVVYHPPVVKPLPPGLPHSRRLEPLQSPSATNLEGSVADDYRRAAAQYGDDPHHHAVEHQTSFVDAPQQARSLAGDSQYQGPATPDIRNTAGEGHFGHGHVMFAAPESPGYVRAQPSHDAYALAPPLPATNAVGGFGHVEEHGYEYEQAREAAALEKERLQAEANTRENDDVYAADATIMPAKHVFPVHAVPEVTNLNEAPASRSVDTQFPASNPTSAAQYSREQPPPHNLVERGSTRTLTVGDWTIRTVKRPILNGKEIDAAAEHLNIPLPEMTFGNNSLDLTYAPDQTSAPLSLNFSALQALADVATGEGWEERNGGGVQVSMAEHWSQNRTQGTSYLSDIPISDKPTKPFDWTYSTTFSGALQSGNFDGFTTSETDSIPMDLLARQDPVLDKIIFYDDVSLFEDELHDNGESVMNVRIRVMPHSFFILSRLFLRVDNVLFRTHDVRIFHAFGSDKIIREIMGRECAYNDMKARLETQDDLSPLNDANFVTQVLSSMPLAPSSSSGKPWPGLGVKRDVLLLDQSRASRSQPQQQTDGDHQTQYQSSALPSIPATSPRADNEGGFATHHQLTTSELQAQTKTSIMDRPRGIRRGGDPAGDGTAGGFNYGYDNSAYFVRNHASSPSNLPRQEEILPESPGLQTETPGFAGDRDAFYTPIGTPDLPRPTTAFHPGTGQRTISASAFRRNKSSLNQSIDGAPVAPYTDAARETASIPATKTGIDEIYQDSAPRPQHGRSTEPEHDNGNLEAQLDHTAARESIPPTYHESFSHSPTFEAGREDESANKDLR